MLVTGLGATAAAAAPAPARITAAAGVAGAAPTTSGRTYVMMNSGRQGNSQSAYYAPSKFFLLRGGPALYAK